MPKITSHDPGVTGNIVTRLESKPMSKPSHDHAGKNNMSTCSLLAFFFWTFDLKVRCVNKSTKIQCMVYLSTRSDMIENGFNELLTIPVCLYASRFQTVSETV